MLSIQPFSSVIKHKITFIINVIDRVLNITLFMNNSYQIFNLLLILTAAMSIGFLDYVTQLKYNSSNHQHRMLKQHKIGLQTYVDRKTAKQPLQTMFKTWLSVVGVTPRYNKLLSLCLFSDHLVLIFYKYPSEHHKQEHVQ